MMAWTAGHAAWKAACLAVFACLLTSGCVLRGPQLSAARTELVDTPFHAQKKYQCGPAALATVLNASGVDASPDELTAQVYLPGRRGSLQLELVAATRAHGRLPLTLTRNPRALVAELEAGHAVLVLQNRGVRFWPRWHYAVLIGYDVARDVFILRSGTTRRQEMRTRTFMVSWHHAGRWAMVALKPGDLAAQADVRHYMDTVAAFERDARPEEVRSAYDAAVRRWPEEPLAWIGRGNAEYRLGNFSSAARDFSAALSRAPELGAARNNLAQTLLDLHCPQRARAELALLDAHDLRAPLREAVLDTQHRAREFPAGMADADACVGIP